MLECCWKRGGCIRISQEQAYQVDMLVLVRFERAPPLFQQHSSIQVPQQLLLLGDELISSWWMHTFVLCLDLEGGGEPTGCMKCYP
jgi:hypothetical protein